MQRDAARVEYLGEGSGDYVLAAGYDVFIVKQRQPFQFLFVDGTVSADGETAYTAPRDDDRVWICSGNCNIPAIYHDAYNLGEFTPGWIVNLLVIDDDGPEQNNDQRRNWWAANNAKDPYLIVEDQQMVEYLFDRRRSANGGISVAGDSLRGGVVLLR